MAIQSLVRVQELTKERKQSIEGILTRAISDIEFRELLLSAPYEALSDSGLTGEEIEILSSMKRVKLEEWGIDVRRFRAWLRDNGNKI